jgi:hypothetical protein
MKCYYSIIPSFHYSCLEYAEWLPGDSLLSTICRISDTFNYPNNSECDPVLTRINFPGSNMKKEFCQHNCYFQNPPPKNNASLLHASRLRVAGLRGRALKNCDKKTTPKFFTSQLETRNSQPSPPRSKKLAVDLGLLK